MMIGSSFALLLIIALCVAAVVTGSKVLMIVAFVAIAVVALLVGRHVSKDLSRMGSEASRTKAGLK